ncbi:MAG: alcohol dehydrogenase [Sphaerisporangium sp.]|jgi:alcohol dehydrogenase|nr:alcohol dehydrogenase [Sphaerisporangium sp.]
MSTYPLPAGISDEHALLVTDILPTAYEVGVRNGHVEPGDTVVIVGAGPVGLAAVITARLYSPSTIIVIDKAVTRLQAAKDLGAHIVAGPDSNIVELVQAATDGLGADVVMEAVGTPQTFELCTTLVRPGGRIANIGVHGKPATLHLEDLWIRDITITTGLVDTQTTPNLLRMLAHGQLDVANLITHRMPLDSIVEAYDIFARAADTGALKVVLTR